ncbi:MAG: hypothetical protein E7001_02895 [Coriobacteriaceae bacterium]|nr:hypothetical protein [Coriobacteriaceae bacterium]
MWRGSAEEGTLVRAYDSLPADRPREDAEALAVAMARRLGSSADRDGGMTLGTFWRTVFPSLPSSRGTPRSKATMRQYTDYMRVPLELLGDKRLNRITHSDLALAVRMSSSPHNAKVALRAVMRAAYDNELVDEMPFQRRVPTHRERRQQAQPWTRMEVREFLHRLRTVPLDPSEDRDEMIAYTVLGLSGLSKSEALGVRPMDIRSERVYSFLLGEQIETVTVEVAMTYTDADGWKSWAKNDHRHRTAAILPLLRGMLFDALDSLAARRGRGWEADRIVQRRSDGMVRDWKRLCDRMGVRYIPPGMLRHTTDTLALTAGVQPDLNDKMHGRSEHSSTYKHYFRPDPGTVEEAARLISESIVTTEHVEHLF